MPITRFTLRRLDLAGFQEWLTHIGSTAFYPHDENHCPIAEYLCDRLGLDPRAGRVAVRRNGYGSAAIMAIDDSDFLLPPWCNTYIDALAAMPGEVVSKADCLVVAGRLLES